MGHGNIQTCSLLFVFKEYPPWNYNKAPENREAGKLVWKCPQHAWVKHSGNRNVDNLRRRNAAWRPCFTRILPQQFFGKRPGKNKVPTKQRESSKCYHRFCFPASRLKRCVAPMPCEHFFREKIIPRKPLNERVFQQPRWKNRVPSTNLRTCHGLLARSAFKALQEVWCVCEPYHTSMVPVEQDPWVGVRHSKQLPNSVSRDAASAISGERKLQLWPNSRWKPDSCRQNGKRTGQEK